MSVYEGAVYVRGWLIILSAILRITAIVGLTLLLPAIVGFFYREFYEMEVFLILGVTVFTISYILGALLPQPRSITLGEALLISGTSWIIVAVIGGIPYVYTIGMSWVDAFFESMSGFTTTGMTLIKVIEGKAKSVLFWRALTQWLGGTGIIMLFLVFATATARDVSLWRLYLAEARDVRIRASTWGTVKDIWLIYFGYTIVCMFTLRLLGLSWYEAITHSFTCLATGGFSTRTESIAAFHNPAVEMALAFFAFIGGTNFLAHYVLFKYGLRRFLGYYEVKAAIFIILCSTGLIVYDLVSHLGIDVFNALRYAIFQTISIMTTTGYTTADINSWPPLSKLILLALMFVGGNLCSTGGAIKVGRIVVTFKVMVNQLQTLFLPSGTVKPIRLGTHILELGDVLKLFTFFTVYFFGIIIGTLILTFYGHEPFKSLSAIASAQGNVGPCYLDLFELNDVCKILLSLHMWLGRLELIPAIALLTPAAWIHAFKRRLR